MTKTMRAAVYRGPRDLRIEEVTRARCGNSDVLIKVHACGICGSDVHSYRAGLYVSPGQVLGHEFAGEVAEVGPGVSDLQPGDRVTGFSTGVCGDCYWCTRGQYALCPRLFTNSTGYGKPGAFAEYVLVENAVPGVNIHRIPDVLADEVAATAEPVSVAVGAITAAGVQPGDSVVVLGGGMIGNACLQVAKAAGAGKAVLVEISPARLAAAEASGADAVFDARGGDALEWVKEQVGVGPYHFNEGAMADVVIEAAGAALTIVQSFEMVRSGGTIVFVGLPEGPAPIDTTKIVHKAPRIVGSLGGDFGRSLDLLAGGQVQTAPLITHTFELADASEAFETQLRADETVKVMVKI
jgi:2-desacetyl-2-hydroxyethyl bacteriochlorophyllide A dehydrogenase